MNKYDIEKIAAMHPKEFRAIARTGEWTEANHDACRGYVPTALAAFPKEFAFDFLLFCLRNPRPCPILDVTEPGDPHPKMVAPDADLRTDMPKYRIFKDGKVIDEPIDATKYWRDDLVAFVLGCSIGIDATLMKANIQCRFNGIFESNIELAPAGPFHGNMAVSCRTFSNSYDAMRAIQISSRLLISHGPPVHIGSPALIGINNIEKPDFPLPYFASPPEPHEITLFWGCAMTPQIAALNARIPYMVMQHQGCLFFTDKLIDEMAII